MSVNSLASGSCVCISGNVVALQQLILLQPWFPAADADDRCLECVWVLMPLNCQNPRQHMILQVPYLFPTLYC